MKNRLYLFKVARGYSQPQATHFRYALLDNRDAPIDDKLSNKDDLFNASDRTVIAPRGQNGYDIQNHKIVL